MLSALIDRGDRISIKRGLVHIEPASGTEPPDEWLKNHGDALLMEILESTGLDAYRYQSFTTGCYGDHKAGGVTLQFTNPVLGTDAYAIFNANLKRHRGVKKGSPLPGKQFRVGKRSEFYKFWVRSGLKMPGRLGLFHDYMGNLRPLAFGGSRHNERFEVGTLTPIELHHDRVTRAIHPNNIQTSAKQLPNNIRTIYPNKDSRQGHTPSGMQEDLTTCVSNYENKDVRVYGNEGSSNPYTQTCEEWLEDYGEGDDYDNTGEAT